MKELYDILDNEFSKFEVETRVSRFYSGENYIVVATVSHDPHTHENITHVMRQHGWALYDVGGNCEYHMFTFKKVMIWIVTKQDFAILNGIEVGREVTPCDVKAYGDEGGAWLCTESEILRHCELYNIPLSDGCFFGEGKNTVRIEYKINGWQHATVWHIGTQKEVL